MATEKCGGRGRSVDGGEVVVEGVELFCLGSGESAVADALKAAAAAAGGAGAVGGTLHEIGDDWGGNDCGGREEGEGDHVGGLALHVASKKHAESDPGGSGGNHGGVGFVTAGGRSVCHEANIALTLASQKWKFVESPLYYPDSSFFMSTSNRYALILAGGSGQRFWPISRDTLPKQLLALFGEKTLLELTVERLEGLVPKENIIILTNSLQERAVRALIKDLPAENIVAEPEKRDTAPAIALAVGLIVRRNPNATMMVLPADHLIQDQAGFHEVLTTAVQAAETMCSLVTVGIKPTWPCPSYGYVERGRSAAIPGGTELPVFEVVRFREKPNPELAEFFLSQGTFSWNAGMFIWTIPAIFSEFSRHCPALADFVSELRTSSDVEATIKHQFGKLPKLSIDYALLERSSHVLNIEATFDWDDVGNWTSVAKYLDEDGEGNRHNCKFTPHEASGNLVFSQTKQHVALLGVQDLIVVPTKDALLIAHKGHAENIKRLVDGLPAALK